MKVVLPETIESLKEAREKLRLQTQTYQSELFRVNFEIGGVKNQIKDALALRDSFGPETREYFDADVALAKLNSKLDDLAKTATRFSNEVVSSRNQLDATTAKLNQAIQDNVLADSKPPGADTGSQPQSVDQSQPTEDETPTRVNTVEPLSVDVPPPPQEVASDGFSISERNEIIQKYTDRQNELRTEIDTTTNQIGQVTSRIDRINNDINEARNKLVTAEGADRFALEQEITELSNDASRLTNTRSQLTQNLDQQYQGLTWATTREQEVRGATELTDNVKAPVVDAYPTPVSEILGVQSTTSAPETVTEDPAVEAEFERQRLEAESVDFDREAQAAADRTTAETNAKGVTTRSEGAAGVQKNIKQQVDWRLRLSLAPNASYLYNTATPSDLLYPLKATSGVVFPYTPQINMSYRANYDPSDLTHTNYKYYFYKNSSVDEFTITADFTAQDTQEANYMLAVIHFFRSVTKMFYGQDSNPRAGTPPPLCYLSGYGQFQFNNHPLLVSGFQYALPNDVDYIRAGSTTQWAGQNISAYNIKSNGNLDPKTARKQSNNIKQPKGLPTNGLSNSEATYVPTKLQVVINMIPVATRAEVSNVFSLRDYATGKLLNKGYW